MKTLILVISMLAFNTNAATKSLGTFGSDASVHFGESYLPVGSWSSDYTFSVKPQGAEGSAQVAWTSLTTANIQAEVLNTVTLEHVANTPQVLASFSVLPGDYTLRVYGTSTKPTDSYAGTLDLKITQTPVPGAIWLFGSALAGLVGFTTRKNNRA